MTRKHTSGTTPLSDRLSELLPDTNDPEVAQLLRKLAFTERAAMAEIAHAHVATKDESWPNWPFGKWVLVLGFLSGILSGVFAIGIRWNTVDRDIADVKTGVSEVKVEISTLGDFREKSQRQLDAISSQLKALVGVYNNSEMGRRRPVAAFPREEQLSMPSE